MTRGVPFFSGSLPEEQAAPWPDGYVHHTVNGVLQANQSPEALFLFNLLVSAIDPMMGEKKIGDA